jgi:hypothetical protein
MPTSAHLPPCPRGERSVDWNGITGGRLKITEDTAGVRFSVPSYSEVLLGREAIAEVIACIRAMLEKRRSHCRKTLIGDEP